MTQNKKTSELTPPTANLSMKLYFRMVKYAIRYWKVFVFSILSLVVLSATNTGFLATIKMVTDEGFVKQDSTKLHVLPLMLLVY
jgi:subfamily B ATP-binding cassette protein MsbA